MTDLGSMTAPGGSDGSPDAPFLPPARPAGSLTAPDDAAVPFLPPPQQAVPEPAAQPEFDAAAMVAAQKSFKADPAYGEMPAGTPEGREAARKLREKANRKKKRGKAMGRVVLLVVVAGLAVGGFFAYQAMSDDADEVAVESVETDEPPVNEGDAAADVPPAGASPLGVIEEGIDAQDALNETAAPSAGGFIAAIDDARNAVDDINGDAVSEGEAAPPEPSGGPVAAATPIVESDVLPIVLDSVAERLTDEADFELYVIDAAAFEAANVGAFDRFLEFAVAQPQGESPGFGLFPFLEDGQIGLGVRRADDGSISRVVIVTADRSLAVDVES